MSELIDVLNENGEYTGKTVTRRECSEKGLWHKDSAAFILSNDGKKVLLQQKSDSQMFWANLWDVTISGHVLSGELGYQSLIREAKEEIGLNLKIEDLKFIGATKSTVGKNGHIHNHFNEIFIIHMDIDTKKLKLQKEEVKDIKWFDRETIIKNVNNNYENLTDKIACWNHLLNYFKILEKQMHACNM